MPSEQPSEQPEKQDSACPPDPIAKMKMELARMEAWADGCHIATDAQNVKQMAECVMFFVKRMEASLHRIVPNA